MVHERKMITIETLEEKKSQENQSKKDGIDTTVKENIRDEKNNWIRSSARG